MGTYKQLLRTIVRNSRPEAEGTQRESLPLARQNILLAQL